jgi:hypothetical protein
MRMGGTGERSSEGAGDGGTRARAQPAASAGVRPMLDYIQFVRNTWSTTTRTIVNVNGRYGRA